MPKNPSTALTGQLRQALKTLERATTPEEQAGALVVVQEANAALRAERAVRDAKTARIRQDQAHLPPLPTYALRNGCTARLEWLARAERGGAVDASGCPPFLPMGKRLQRDGLLTLERRPRGGHCNLSVVRLTAKGASTLARLRAKHGIPAPVLSPIAS